MKKLTKFGFLLILVNIGLINCEFEDREDLSFIIEAVYKGEDVEWIGLRGNGLGLDLHKSLSMVKESDDKWIAEIQFKSGLRGFQCMDCQDQSGSLIPNGDDLKIQFFAITTNGTEFEVGNKGPFYRIPLPVSRVSSSFEDQPVFTFYPYFFNTIGNYFILNVDSGKPGIGDRDIVVYLPPGVYENPKPVYDNYFVIDLNPNVMSLGKTDVDKIFSEGASHDVILIGHGDWGEGTDRNEQLTPVVGDNLLCKEGTFDNLCNNCLPANFTEEEYNYWMIVGGCGVTVVTGGGADDNIDFLLGTVFDEVDSHLRSNYLTSVTTSREGTFIIGYSQGGLFSCYTAWTRPESFGGAGCHSSSFWYPSKVENVTSTPQFHFVNSVLNTHLDDRLPQKILIDVGDLEQDPIYQMVGMANIAYDIIGTHPVYEKDKNLWLQVFPGKDHSMFVWLERLWIVFTLLSGDRN